MNGFEVLKFDTIGKNRLQFSLQVFFQKCNIIIQLFLFFIFQKQFLETLTLSTVTFNTYAIQITSAVHRGWQKQKILTTL